MAQELKYYHGEASNPYEEINEQQGAWCMRYNTIASMLWDFEYHWANGWDKFSKLTGHNRAYYFEQHKHPQKDFASLQEALMAFAWDIYSNPLYLGSERWVTYIYDHAMLERFYKPVVQIIPRADIPNYLHWYTGEQHNPYRHEPPSSTKAFWWDFEANWYKRTEQVSEQSFAEHLQGWFVERVWSRSAPMPKGQLQEFEKAYKAGKQPVWL